MAAKQTKGSLNFPIISLPRNEEAVRHNVKVSYHLISRLKKKERTFRD